MEILWWRILCWGEGRGRGEGIMGLVLYTFSVQWYMKHLIQTTIKKVNISAAKYCSMQRGFIIVSLLRQNEGFSYLKPVHE
jgi:hypothetical protein